MLRQEAKCSPSGGSRRILAPPLQGPWASSWIHLWAASPVPVPGLGAGTQVGRKQVPALGKAGGGVG